MYGVRDDGFVERPPDGLQILRSGDELSRASDLHQVWHILQGDQDLREQYAPLVKHLEELHNLYKVLDKAREERGGISFESEEAKFIFNAERRIERIEQTQRNDAHKLIEECMILANISAARFVESERTGTVPYSRQAEHRSDYLFPFSAGGAGAGAAGW